MLDNVQPDGHNCKINQFMLLQGLMTVSGIILLNYPYDR